MKKEKGLFITLEGGEGSGKSTIIRMLSELFQRRGHEVVLFREPGGTPFAEGMRELFMQHDNLSAETVALLMNSARVDNIEKIIQPALDEGKIVIADRFSGSSLVYQGIYKNQFQVVDSITRHLPMISVFLDVPPEVGLKRIADNNREMNRIDKLPLEKHQVLYEGYKQLKELKPDIYWDVILDGTRTINEIETTLDEEVVDTLSRNVKRGCSTTELKELMRLMGNRKFEMS